MPQGSDPLDISPETPPKRGRGRPQGSRNQVKVLSEPLKNARMVSLMEGCYPAEEWLRRFRKLSPELQFRLRSMVEPRMKEEAPVGKFVLEVHGLEVCPKCGWRGGRQEENPAVIDKPAPALKNPDLPLPGYGNRIDWAGDQ